MNSSETQIELQKTLEEIQNAKNVRMHFNKIVEELSDAYRQLDRYEEKLDKEYNDWQQLESLSVKSLFHKVLGSKEEQIERERQDYLQASLKYNEFKKSVDILEYEKSLLEKKLLDISLLQNKLKTLKKRRTQELLMSNSPKGVELKNILRKSDEQLVLRNEIRSAVTAGNQSSQMLDKMLSYLQQAKNWGNWDMMGKGRMASYNKHDAIDRAKDAASHSKHLLNRFQQELYSLGAGNFSFDITMDSLSSFTDIFFDNLISDWIMQQKIKNALSSVFSVRDKVERIVQSLENDLKKIDENINELKLVKERIILES